MLKFSLLVAVAVVVALDTLPGMEEAVVPEDMFMQQELHLMEVEQHIILQ